MAEQIQTLIDSNRKLLVKIVGNTSQSLHTVIDAGGLKFALNANNQLLVFQGNTGTDRKAFYHLELKSINYCVMPGQALGNGYVQLVWSSTNNNTILATLAGSGQMLFNQGGEPFTVNNNANIVDAGASGNVALQTVNFAATGGMYTILLDFRKNPNDYGAGSESDPMAFNQGVRSTMGQV